MQKRTGVTTDGAHRLADLCEKVGETAVGRRIGEPQQNVRRWRLGECRPSGAAQLLMRRVLRIPLEAWLTEGERKSLHTASIRRDRKPRKRAARPVPGVQGAS